MIGAAIRSLLYYRRMSVAVIGATAIATAVLTGALLVGDSITQSLRGLTLDRLGRIEHALVTPGLFDVTLVERLAASDGYDARFDPPVPFLIRSAAATHARSKARASRIAVQGIDARFARLFDGATALAVLETESDGTFPPVVISEGLQHELGAQLGDPLLLLFEGASDVPRETVLGRRDADDALRRMRVELAGVLPNSGPGRFGLTPRQSITHNAYVRMADLQAVLDSPGKVNAVAVGSGDGARVAGRDVEAFLARDLEAVVRLDDLGLTLSQGDGDLALESRELVLRSKVIAAARAAASETGASVMPILTYLANEMRIGDRSVPYSTVSAIEVPESPTGLVDEAGVDVPTPANGEILLNSWAAADLAATVGAELELTYFRVGAGDELVTTSERFRVAGVVAIEGLGADQGLTPEFPGIADADDMSAWEPPFPLDLGAIGDRDEEYWDAYRGTPKAFVSLEDGRRLWQSRFGDLTAIRFVPPAGRSLDWLEQSLRTALVTELPMSAWGFDFQAVRREGLDAASGASDFSGLFIGFSLFLIVSAALLVGLLFGLSVEGRTREVGLRLAIGHPARSVLRLLATEGLMLGAVGALVGTGIAVAYAGLVLRGLGSWWSALVETPFLVLHARPAVLLSGYFASVLLVLFAVVVSLRRLRRYPTRQLLAGAIVPELSRSTTRLRRVSVASALLAATLVVASLAIGVDTSAPLFFAVGALVCIAGVSGFSLWSRGVRGGLENTRNALGAMALRNNARNPGRSLLSVALVTSATFTLVSVSASRKDFSQEDLGRSSGAGGFAFLAESDVPIRSELDDADALVDLGFDSDAADRLMTIADLYPLRLLPGEDASCQNLYQPEQPRLLGVPTALVERGGFGFRSMTEEVDNPWTLLERDLGPDVVPAFGDFNSVMWILHLGLGDDLVMVDDHGDEVKIRIVGTLNTSIFQSELLISEAAFLEHFPSHGGYGYFLGESDGAVSAEASTLLEAGLADYGFDAVATVERLRAFQAVENMYLTTFEALGGLGLLLGTAGLGIVLVRNVIERRGELATLRACGFRGGRLATMVVAENAVLLVAGIAVGGAAGLIAVLPHLAGGNAPVPWGGLAVTLGAVLLVGLLASIGAVIAAVRAPLIPILKAE